jgi:hypothetical protein
MITWIMTKLHHIPTETIIAWKGSKLLKSLEAGELLSREKRSRWDRIEI